MKPSPSHLTPPQLHDQGDNHQKCAGLVVLLSSTKSVKLISLAKIVIWRRTNQLKCQVAVMPNFHRSLGKDHATAKGEPRTCGGLR